MWKTIVRRLYSYGSTTDCLKHHRVCDGKDDAGGSIYRYDYTRY